MKRNKRVLFNVNRALINGDFSQTLPYKESLLYNADINIDISAVVYSDQMNSRVGEVGIPLNALFYENAIDSVTIIDDTNNIKATELWEREILFNQLSPSQCFNPADIDSIELQDKLFEWDRTDKIKSNFKHILRTNHIGIWKAYEMGSRLTYIPLNEQNKKLKKNDLDLILLLDSYHQLPFHDEWIKNAVALFEQYPNLQVLGGFSGVIQNGNTFGDINVNDRRTNKMDEEPTVFILSRESDYYKQQNNKRKYDEARMNIVDMLDDLRDEYYEKYWKKFWKKAKKKWQKGVLFNDDENNDFEDGYDEDEFHLFDTDFISERDKYVFLNRDDENYDPEKVQTGLEAIKFEIKKRFLKKYRNEIENRLPIPKKLIYKIQQKKKFCKELLENKENEEDENKIADCERIMKGMGQTMTDYHFIPYEQQIRILDEKNNQIKTTWIPFMFITTVQMGPIFVRKSWWFDKLLPHLTNLDKTMGTFNQNWFDIELSLHTWSLGGYVGLYDAEGFKFDQNDFEVGLNRNSKIDQEWLFWEQNHMFAQPELNWNIWNVSHLIELNEGDTNSQNLKLRTSVDSTSKNPAHPVGLENARQILLTLKEFEQAFDLGHKNKNKILRLENENRDRLQNNPLN